MNIREIDGFYSNNFYYGDTDSAYTQKKHWAKLVENGYLGKSLGLSENDYGNAVIFYDWFLSPKTKFCLVINGYRAILAQRSFKGFSEEHRCIKPKEIKSLLEGETVSGMFSIDWTKTFEENEIPHRKKNCLDCDTENFCNDCFIKPKMTCFICTM